jgi:hypothetical protein
MHRGSWKRRAALIGALGMLGSMAMLAASASADSRSRAAPKTAALLFVVQGTGGTYTASPTGADVLALTGVDEQATWFTDRPDRQAGTTAISTALPMIGFDDDPPNGVLTVSDADADHDAIAVKLENPRYDGFGALTFDATPLEKPGDGLRAYRSRLDETVGDSFGGFSLFIDDADTPVDDDGTPEPTEPTEPSDTAPEPETAQPDPGAASPQPKLSFALHFNAAAPVKVTPLWDAANNCILDQPFPTSFDGYLNNQTIRIDAWKNFDGWCAIEESRMHWRIESPGFAEEVRMYGAGGQVVQCIDLQGREQWNVSCSNGGGEGGGYDVPADVNVTPTK